MRAVGRSRADLLALHKAWIEAAGGRVAEHEVELAPAVSYAGEGLEAIKGKTATGSGIVENREELLRLFT